MTRLSFFHFIRIGVSVIVVANVSVRLEGQTVVTLQQNASPATAETGLTTVSVTGINFPAGTIAPANVTVTLTAKPPATGPARQVTATTVANLAGTSKRVSFLVPVLSIAQPTAYLVTIANSVQGQAFTSGNSANLLINPPATITSVTPSMGQAGTTVPVTIQGLYSNFFSGTSKVTVGAGINVQSIVVSSPTVITAQFVIDATTAVGPRPVTVTTASEVATLAGAFTVTAAANAPTITDFNPKSVPVGTLVTISGTNLQPNSGTAAQVTLAKQGGGTILGPVSNAAATSLAFVVPAGAATGPLSVTVNGASANTTTPLTITPSSSFSVSASPNTGDLVQGQSAAYAVSLTSTTGFDQLATLNVTGLPAGVTASFKPQLLTAGQTSVLSLSAPTGQPTGSTTLTVGASAIVDGITIAQSMTVSLNVTPVTTSFLGRTVVSDSLETPLAGVTITMLGKDGNGNTTGCTGGTTSDGAGNFLLSNLPMQCIGPQLVGFDGTTVTGPAGKYAGVNLVFSFVSGQVTASPVLIHLPRIDNVETFLVTQNSPSNQTHAFTSIPGLSVTVYAGTTFTMPDGTQPNPFPLAAVQVPVDRLPDAKPQVPTMMRVFIVAFQPANATTNEPVAVYFPNTINTPPGTDMALMTLDPTHGQMVPYGTGTVSSDGTQIVPDADPAHPGHLYGLIHFDWHGPMPPPPPMSNPGPPGGGGPDGPCAAGGLGSGPGGGVGPGGSSCVGPTPPPPPQPQPQPSPPCSSCPCATSLQNQPPNFATAGELAQAAPPAEAGDPVDLFSGIMTITNTDISVSGVRGSIPIVRTYRSLSGNPGPFGIGTGFNYGYQLGTAFVGGEGPITLVMPDGNQFSFSPQPGGTLTNTTIPALMGAVMTSPASEVYNLRWKNGTLYQFQSSSAGGLIAFLTSITDANGNVTQVSLNPSVPGQVTQITDPVGRSLTLNYDSLNRITSIMDPIGRSVQYSYNAQGSLSTFTDAAGAVTRYTYDSNNNLLTLTDARGIVQAQNILDSAGRVIQQFRPDGGILTFSYTFLNPLASTSEVMEAQVTDSQGVQAIYRFNPNGFVTDVTATQGQTRHLPRAAGTNQLMSVTESSSTQIYTYDGNGNVLTSTDATGLTTQFTYEPVFNKVTSITDPLGNVSRFSYDNNGNLLSSIDANGNMSSYQYNSMGLLVQSTDALNQKTTFTYDNDGNLASTADPQGNTTSYVYDAISRLVQTKDALGRQTSFTYDPLNRLLTRTDAKTDVTQFAYDPNGNLLSVKDARSNTTTFTYDVMNRLATRTDALGHNDTRTYDTDGNLVTFVDRRGQTSAFAYDNLNRLTGELYSDATVARSYDVLGRLAHANDSAAGQFEFTFDPAGRLTSSSTPVGTTNYSYDGRGAMALRQVAGEPALNYTYDPAANLTSAALPQASATFAYNARNQLADISRLNGVSSAYAYDSDARLLTMIHAAGANTIDAESYTYDAVGNRASHSTSIGQAIITQPTANQYNAANQLTLFGLVPDSYDGNGNLVQQGTTTAYTWDGRSRLKSIVTAAGQTTNFTYDFAGNLIQQADTGTSLNLTKSFVLDDVTNVAYEAASDGTSYSLLSGRAIDSHLAIVQSNGQVQYGLADAINSTIATVDQAGALRSQFLYDPFGQTTTTGTYPFQFTGRVQTSANLYYYRARFYNAATGRFISEDPIGFSGGDPNLYRYALNNPLLRTDPMGTDAGGPWQYVGRPYNCQQYATKCSTECYLRCDDPSVAAACSTWCSDRVNSGDLTLNNMNQCRQGNTQCLTGREQCLGTGKFPDNPYFTSGGGCALPDKSMCSQ